MQSVNILIQALQQYEGSYIVVSHDRYFVENIATKIWYIEDHQIKEYPGTYQEYELWIEERGLESAVSEKAIVSSAPPPKSTAASVASNGQKKESVPKPNNQWALKQAQKQVEELEATITDLEAQKKKLEVQLADPANYAEKDSLDELNAQYAHTRQKIADVTKAWEVAMLEAEELEG